MHQSRLKTAWTHRQVTHTPVPGGQQERKTYVQVRSQFIRNILRLHQNGRYVQRHGPCSGIHALLIALPQAITLRAVRTQLNAYDEPPRDHNLPYIPPIQPIRPRIGTKPILVGIDEQDVQLLVRARERPQEHSAVNDRDSQGRPQQRLQLLHVCSRRRGSHGRRCRSNWGRRHGGDG